MIGVSTCLVLGSCETSYGRPLYELGDAALLNYKKAEFSHSTVGLGIRDGYIVEDWEVSSVAACFMMMRWRFSLECKLLLVAATYVSLVSPCTDLCTHIRKKHRSDNEIQQQVHDDVQQRNDCGRRHAWTGKTPDSWIVRDCSLPTEKMRRKYK